MSTRIDLHFGALAQKIADQLHAAGFDVDADFCSHWQQDADAITRLCVRGFLPDSAAHRARLRLIKKIAADLQP